MARFSVAQLVLDTLGPVVDECILGIVATTVAAVDDETPLGVMAKLFKNSKRGLLQFS